ncbi:tyrosine phosphatase family protein [Lichenicoccus sp.]|uniref:tyrosine phosphatase family protein n=1 Tax=Lichenicoccus sp. TaxID=2781899 RepID=UPI003D0C03CC
MSAAPAPFGITVCGIEELCEHGGLGASHVLSILDPGHPVPEAFGTYGEHARLELRFHDIIEPTEGEVCPEPAHVEAILAFGRSLQDEAPGAARLLVHCHAGISRSTACLVLILAQAMPEASAAEIVRMVHGIREKAWPNLRLIELGDAMLQRSGTLVSATHALHRLQLERRPHIAEYMEKGGRGREVQAALLSVLP